jgi:hypothetical protein
LALPVVVALVAALARRPLAAAVVLLVRLPLSVQPLVPADLVALLVAQLPLSAQLPVLLVVKAQLPIPPHLVVEAQLLVLADLVVLVAAVPLQHLLSRQSFSAAMARSSPIPLPQTYKPGRSSR